MKNVAILIISLAAVVMASPKFVGWDKGINDYKAQMADTTASFHYRAYCAYMVAYLETPDTLKDISSIEEFFRQYLKENGKYVNEVDVRDFTAHCIAHSFRRDLAKLLVTHPDYAKNKVTILAIKGYMAQKLGVAQTPAERKAALVDAIPVCLSEKEVTLGTNFLNEYIELTAGDSDEDVLPNLRRIYRLALPKLENDIYKPLVVKLSLALKARGEDIK